MIPQTPIGYVFGNERIRFFDLRSGEILEQLSVPGLRSLILKESPDLGLLGSLANGVFHWPLSLNPGEGTILVGRPSPLPIPQDTWGMALSNDQSTLYVAHSDHIHVKDIESHGLMGLQEYLLKFPEGNPDTVFLDEAGKSLVASNIAGRHWLITLYEEGSTTTWKELTWAATPNEGMAAVRRNLFQSSKRTLRASVEIQQGQERVRWQSIPWVSRAGHVFVAAGDGVSVVADGSDAEKMRLSSPLEGETVAIDVDDRSRWLVAGTARNDVSIWNLAAMQGRLQSMGWPIDCLPQKSTSKNETRWSVRGEAGDFEHEYNSYLERTESLSSQIAAGEERIKAHFMRGFLYQTMKGGASLGMSDFQAARALPARTVAEYHYRGMAAFYLDDYAAAVTDLKEGKAVLERDPASYSSQFQLYLILSRTLSLLPESDRDMSLALECAQTLVSLKPNSAPANAVLAFAYVRLGEFDAAKSLLEEYQDNFDIKNSPSFWFFSALASIGVNQSLSAREQFETGEKLWQLPGRVTQGRSLVSRLHSEVAVALKEYKQVDESVVE